MLIQTKAIYLNAPPRIVEGGDLERGSGCEGISSICSNKGNHKISITGFITFPEGVRGGDAAAAALLSSRMDG